MCVLSLFFSPFSIAITSLGEERANLSAFRTFDRFVLVWICRFPLPLGVWEGLRFVIVALLGLFSYLFCLSEKKNGCIFFIVLLSYIIQVKKMAQIGDRFILLQENPVTGTTITISRKQVGDPYEAAKNRISKIIVYKD